MGPDLTCMVECLTHMHYMCGVAVEWSIRRGCVVACLVGVCTRTGCHTNQQQCESLSLTPNESNSPSFAPTVRDLQTVLPALILAGGWELVGPVYTMQRVLRMGRCVGSHAIRLRGEGGGRQQGKARQGKARRCDAMDGFGNALFCHVTSACCGHFTAYTCTGILRLHCTVLSQTRHQKRPSVSLVPPRDFLSLLTVLLFKTAILLLQYHPQFSLVASSSSPPPSSFIKV
jgi:hypothetical protein